MNNNQTVERLKQMRLAAMALHCQHIKDNRIESVTLMNTWHCLQITSGKSG